MCNRELVAEYLDVVDRTLKGMRVDEIDRVATVLQQARIARQRVFIVGNGGSASTASHFACDLAKGARRPDVPAVRAHALADNLAILTAWANDVHYAEVYSSQMDGLVSPGDVIVAISTSGTSENVLRAVDAGRAAGAITIGFAGQGGLLKDRVDYCISVASDRTSVIEDVHMAICHLLTDVLLRGGHDEGSNDTDGVLSARRAKRVADA